MRIERSRKIKFALLTKEERKGRANMNNAEIAKKLADKNCLVCVDGEKNGNHVICRNSKSPLVNRMTSGFIVCDEFSRVEDIRSEEGK